MQIKKYILSLLIVLGVLAVGTAPVLAQDNPRVDRGWGMGMMKGVGANGTIGQVTAINGTTLTVVTKAKPGGTATTYTVNAANATVMKGGQTSTPSSFVVGDTVIIQGTISGTTITATVIKDGKAKPEQQIQGNGQPVIAGNVTAVSGNTITVSANNGSVVYTVDAMNAEVHANGAIGTISNIAVGDSVVVQGTVNGTSVIASSIIDNKKIGFFGGIMGFFKNLFRF